MADLKYSIDTSALIDGLERYYPRAIFPALWERVANLVADGRFFVSEEVWLEARKHDAAVKDWCDEVGKVALVKPTDARTVTAVQGLLTDYPRMVADMKGRNRADPFVIVTAEHQSAVVVTGEGSDGNDKRPKIPFVCAERGVDCYRFLDIAKLEKWSFA